MSTVLQAGEARVEAAPRFPRPPKGISGRSIAILVFLSICAAFFCVPLYVIVTTSFKTMEQIRDPNTALIEPLREYLSRPLTTKGDAAQQAALAHREITVLADKSLPYEVIRKVMTTCTAAAYDKLSLAVLETSGSAAAGG